MNKKLKVYEAQFKPTIDDGEKMLQIKQDFKGLFENNNRIAEWFMAMIDKMASDDKRMDTLDNILLYTENMVPTETLTSMLKDPSNGSMRTT